MGGLVGDQAGIAVVGSGYVGTVVAACLASVGHRVYGVEIDPERLERLRLGDVPFYEPRLSDVVREAVDSGRLTFTDNYGDALAATDVVFLCVDTPPGDNGHPDMSSVGAAARSIGRAMDRPHVLVTKSTVPVGSGRWLQTTIENELPEGTDPHIFSVVSNPEFLREGSAVADFLYPERIVLGGDDPAAIDRVAAVYEPIIDQSFEGGLEEKQPALVKTDRSTAETIKYAANAFLATKISFINEIATISEWLGADVNEVAYAIGLDSRIGPKFLNAGVGWGGSCFGKDLDALAAMAREHGHEPLLLEAVKRVNHNQRHMIVRKLQQYLRPLRGRRIALLGLSFKPNTDDMRDAPAITVARSLTDKGAILRAFDPMVTEIPELPDLKTVVDPYHAVVGADAVVLLTEWPEFLALDFHEIADRMRGDVVIDGRNALDPGKVEAAGLIYEGVGRYTHLENGNGNGNGNGGWSH
jgi:nucleotide sugar dehydrogenase